MPTISRKSASQTFRRLDRQTANNAAPNITITIAYSTIGRETVVVTTPLLGAGAVLPAGAAF
jgi:hypothetical protein